MQINLFFTQKAHFTMCLLFIFVAACQQDNIKQSTNISTPQNRPNELLSIEQNYIDNLSNAIGFLDSLLRSNDHSQWLGYYKQSRQAFKAAAPILSAIDKDSYKSLNGPNLLKIHEEDATDIKISNPFGYQVIEEMLFEPSLDTAAITKVSQLTKNRLKLLLENTHLKLEKRHILWLVRDAIIRITTMGITGFDSPALSNSLQESIVEYQTIKNILATYKHLFTDDALYQSWITQIESAQLNLKSNFDTFDRYAFIQNHTHPQLQLWVQTLNNWQVQYEFELAIKHNATSLFSDSTFNLNYFADYHQDPYNKASIALGKRLFNDTSLSKNKDMSCATCHQKDKAFTDGLAIFPKQKRNSPTLAYAALQQSFFHDARAGSLEGQIVNVVNNPNEFHSDLSQMVEAVKANNNYKMAFDTIFNGEISDANIRIAIANYIRDLSPFNSKFDKNINQLENTLSEAEKNGFNLFMGKAACATCHFPPIFNGTVPPHFSESEMEMLGTLTTPDSPTIDDDLGRYHVFKTEERKFFFKTPTIRNISLTAPYMHHGTYATLEQVMNFYNHGGGAGSGLDLPLQTLPSDSLHLSNQEINDIIAFMKTLEDNGLKN